MKCHIPHAPKVINVDRKYENRSCKAGKEQIKSAAFINAPKEDERQNNKQSFLTKQGDKRHQRIAHGCADTF